MLHLLWGEASCFVRDNTALKQQGSTSLARCSISPDNQNYCLIAFVFYRLRSLSFQITAFLASGWYTDDPTDWRSHPRPKVAKCWKNISGAIAREKFADGRPCLPRLPEHAFHILVNRMAHKKGWGSHRIVSLLPILQRIGHDQDYLSLGHVLQLLWDTISFKVECVSESLESGVERVQHRHCQQLVWLL